MRADGRSESPPERADRNWNDILQEVRIAQTSTQILGGFLLAVCFQPRFVELDSFQLAWYLSLVALAGVATALGLAVVGAHRVYFRRLQKPRMVRLGNRLLVANLTVVGVLTAGVIGLVFDFAHSRVAGVIALGMGIVVVIALSAFVPIAGVSVALGERPGTDPVTALPDDAIQRTHQSSNNCSGSSSGVAPSC